MADDPGFTTERAHELCAGIQGFKSRLQGPSIKAVACDASRKLKRSRGSNLPWCAEEDSTWLKGREDT